MNITKRNINGIIILDLEGELDLFSSPILSKEIISEIEQKNTLFIIRLEKASYVDSSGLGSLIQARKNARNIKGEVVLSSISPDIKHIFELAKMDVFFKFFPDDEKALEFLKKLS